MSTASSIRSRRIALLACLSVATVLGASPGHAQDTHQPFFRWTDFSLTLLPYGWGFVVDPSEQTTVTFEHAHDSKIGDLFLFVDFAWQHDAPEGTPDTRWYGEISPRLSAGKVLGKDLSFSLFSRSLFEVKDVLLATAYERGEDADLAEAVLIGVGVDLAIRGSGPIGRLGKFKYIQLNVYARNSLIEGAEPGFSDVQITMAAAKPFGIGQARFLIDGYFDWVLGLGSAVWTYHLNPQLSVDVGNFLGKPDALFAGCELDFWWNKYQIQDTPEFDTDQAAVSLLVKYHF